MGKHLDTEVIDLAKKIIAVSGDVSDPEKAAELCAAITLVGCMVYDSFGINPTKFSIAVAELMPTANSAVKEAKEMGVSL